jgi:hypothetical protein
MRCLALDADVLVGLKALRGCRDSLSTPSLAVSKEKVLAIDQAVKSTAVDEASRRMFEGEKIYRMGCYLP